MATHHTLSASRSTLHGHFSRELSPVLTIDPGDSVAFECLDSGWGLEPHNGVDIHRKEFEPRDAVLDRGHALTGPVAIRGARPGQTLAVRFDKIDVVDWGTTFAGGWSCAWNERLGISSGGVFHLWTFDKQNQTATNQHGQTVAIRPFMGVAGTAPAEPGVHSTTPPRNTGGNIDCKALVAGSTLYLPIEVDGALFSVGDGHAAQGDGEVCVTAIECPMNVTIAFDLIDDAPLKSPYANTPAGWITLGFHADLDEALILALEAMLTLMQHQFEIGRLNALALASVAVDFRITQAVNGTRGVHAVLPHGAIQINAPA